MSAADARVFVALGLRTHLVGTLWVSGVAGRETATFEYDPSWLAHDDRFALEPALTLSQGPFHTRGDQRLFGALGDSAPDRWGRTLLARDESHRARAAGRTPRTLREIDYLLGVHDALRQGALRFASQDGGPFLATAPDRESIPPLVWLSRLLGAADHVTDDQESAADLALLLAPGSSLGGARPKAAVRDRDGTLLTAKFPARTDQWDQPAWEAITHALAQRAGLAVPTARLESVGGRAVYLARRFDRAGEGRIPYLSAQSALGAVDGERYSYLDVADAVQRMSAAPREDLAELWRRIVFTVLVSNTDNHLRNHGLLCSGKKGWRLAPQFDVNPSPGARTLATAIADPADPAASLSRALEIAERFLLRQAAARSAAGEIGRAVKAWRAVAREHGRTSREIERMAPAFEHEDLAEAAAMR